MEHNVYQSPLTDERVPVQPVARAVQQVHQETETRKQVVREVPADHRQSSEEVDSMNMVTIEEEMSLHEVIEGLHYERSS